MIRLTETADNDPTSVSDRYLISMVHDPRTHGYNSMMHLFCFEFADEVFIACWEHLPIFDGSNAIQHIQPCSGLQIGQLIHYQPVSSTCHYPQRDIVMN